MLSTGREFQSLAIWGEKIVVTEIPVTSSNRNKKHHVDNSMPNYHGTHHSTLTSQIFSLFVMIFPWFLPCFPWFNIGPEQIPCTMAISDNLNTCHCVSLIKQTLAYLSREVRFNFIKKKENKYLTILQNKITQFRKGLIMWKHFNFSYLALSKPMEKYFHSYLQWLFQAKKNLITLCFTTARLNAQKRLLYITLSLMSLYVFKPKKENINTLYITPCLNVTSCIKIKTRK